METIIGLLFGAGIGFYIYKYFKKIKISQEVASTNIDINNETDLLMAKLSVRRLKKHFDNVDDEESINILNDTIDKLQYAIEEYQSYITSTLTVENESDEEENKSNQEIDNYAAWDNLLEIPYIFKNLSVVLQYKDSKGEISNRRVNVNKYDGVYLYGYCHLKKAIRTFRIDRIIDISDGSTGEIIKDLDIYFEGKYKETPSYVLDKLFNDYYNLLRILLYIVKADGRYTIQEKIIVRELMRSLIEDEIEVSDKELDTLMRDLEIPTVHAYKLAVGKFSKQTNSIAFDIVKVAEDIIGTDKNIHKNEEFALEYIKKKIS